MGALPPVFIEFLGKATGFHATAKGVKAELAEVEAEGGGKMAKLGAVGKGALLGIGVAAAAAAYESVKMAASYQTTMTKLSTLAHVSKGDVAQLSSGILDLAGKVGFSPDSLGEAMYHIESSFASVGIKGPTALNLLKVAAEGAQVGNANLVDVTNALDAAVASGIPGVQNYQQAMGAMLSIVGSGDMEMQDLADAMGTGMVAAVKGYGLSLNDVGAGLAVFGDNNMRGADAATSLRMAVQSLAVPAAGSGKELKALGLSTTTLRKDMESGGLQKALNDLADRMKHAGVTSKEQAAVITTLFGKKAGTGLDVLIGQIDRLNGKYPELAKGAHSFGSAWQQQGQTFNQQMKNLQSGFEALGVKIGTALLPYATKFLGWLQHGMTYLVSHKAAVTALAGAIGGVLVIGLTAAAVAAAEFTVALLANPVTWIVLGVVALGAALVMLITHWKQVWGWIASNIPMVANTFRSVWQGTMAAFHAVWSATMNAVHAIVKWFDANVLKWVQARAADFTKWWSQNGAMVSAVWGEVWASVKAIAAIVWDWLGVAVTNLVSIFTIAWDLIVGAIKLAWAIISGIVTFAIHLVMNTITIALDIMTGHWGKVWGDLIHLVSQAFADIWHFLSGVAQSLWGTLTQVGNDIINGIVNGISSAGSAIYDTLKQLAGDALKSVKSFLGINSPSRVFRDEVGHWIPAGIAEGVHANAEAAHGAIRKVARGMVEAANSELEINSPSRKFRQIGIWVHLGLVAGLTGTHAQVEAAVKKTLTLLMEMHTRAASHLEGYVAREGRALENLAAKRDAIANRLKAAQKTLSTLQGDWTKERDSVASNIMQNASVVMSNSNGPIGAGDVVANMYDQMEQSQAFAANINRLKAEGLRTDLIQQIASAGVSGGGQTASALAHATQSQIAQLNGMQKNLLTSADQTGGAVADAMYGAGINSAKGLIKGLQSQEGAIQKMMLQIAESMSTAIRRALRIHSPSRVFHEIGQFITAGLANGIDESAHKPLGAINRLTGAIVGAAQPKPIALGGGSGGTVIYSTTVEVRVEGSVRSDHDLRDVIQAEMLKLGARNSGTWVPYRRR